MAKKVKEIPAEIFDLVCYDENSPTGLVYKHDIKAGYEHRAVCRKAGQIAGTRTFHGGAYALYKGYCCHRIIWIIFHGKIPDGCIVDHIDRNRRNNKIENLRLTTTAGNAQNQKMYSTNKSGITGVYFNKHPSPNGRWTAVWKQGGRILQKSFNISVYGDKALELATEYRKKMVLKMNADGAEYTIQHGTEVINEVG